MQFSTYIVLRDSPFDLDEGNVRRFTAAMPPSPGFYAQTAMPVLSFRLHHKSNRLKFLVILNDAPGDANVPQDKIEFIYDFEGSAHRHLRSMHEVLSGPKFVAGSDNFIDFRVIAGEASFSDVVLFHRMQG